MTDRIWLKVLSVLLGIFAWIYVNLVVPPQVRRSLIAEVEYRNAPELLQIAPARPQVTVQVEGNRRDFILSGASKLQVTVDLYNLRPGRAQLPVRVTSSPGLSVVSVTPPQVQVEAVPVLKKKFDVMLEVQGQPADGYLADEPRVTPEKVVLVGPESLINRVTSCQVEVNLDQVKNSISEQRLVKVYLESGITSDEIEVTPNKVSVDVTVKQGFPTKIVPLAKPVFINKLPEGKKLDGFRVFPEEILISGPTRQLNQIRDISFKPIDLSKIEKSGSVVLKLELPGDKIQLVGSDTVFVELFLADIKIVRHYSGLPFELKKSDKQHASVSVSSYSIDIEGFLSDVDKVGAAQLKMILDVKKMKPGSYPVNLTAPTGLPEKVSVIKISPESLNIQISELDDSPAVNKIENADIEPVASASDDLKN
ncbi:MAG: hypothetical protein EOM80_03430 [Erysipelotrichia bacterium]|nr:CdaR family protein [Candidatus Riflebacteria bacterium]NCB37797.1 hypothetical protein [Erysipelotrichia bacterium]